MKKILSILLLICSVSLVAQRIIFPGQDLLFPHVNDPSYIGLNGDVTAMGMLQITNYERKQHSQFANAQLPVSENLSFGVDYFKDALDYYNYSTAMASVAYKITLGESESYVRIGASAGIDSRRQDRFPIDEIPNMEEFVPRINESNIGFAYRAGIHYNWNNLSLGGSYNRLPIQSVLVRNNIEDLLGYWIEEGFTANVRYGFDITESIRISPILRYLSYADDPIYEGALLVDVGNFASASVSYKNDYSINPALRFELFDALQIGYSYEMSIGDVNFEDIHSLSISYRIKKDSRVESEWIQNAQDTNEKVAAIKPKKEKKPEPKPEVVIDEKPELPKAPETIEVKPVIVEEAPEPIDVVEEEIKSEPVVVEKEVVKPEPKPVVVQQPKAVLPTRTANNNSMLSPGYYIIVGDFESKAEAEAEKMRLKKMEYFTTIAKKTGDDTFYLYIDSDKTTANAQKRLRAHKLDKNFKNAYLLAVE